MNTISQRKLANKRLVVACASAVLLGVTLAVTPFARAEQPAYARQMASEAAQSIETSGSAALAELTAQLRGRLVKPQIVALELQRQIDIAFARHQALTHLALAADSASN